LEQRLPRTSELLTAIATSEGDERILFGDLIAAMRNRAFGLLFLIFGIPNCLPMPPGIPVICGIILALIAAQMVVGRDELWLPQRLAVRSFARTDLQRIVNRARPWIERLERYAKPRYAFLAGPMARRIIGAVVVFLGFVLILPIPFLGNMPPGIAICVFGLGLVERDGLIIVLGYVATVLGLLVTVAMTWLIWQGAVAIF
jgi:hypothetical protein